MNLASRKMSVAEIYEHIILPAAAWHTANCKKKSHRNVRI